MHYLTAAFATCLLLGSCSVSPSGGRSDAQEASRPPGSVSGSRSPSSSTPPPKPLRCHSEPTVKRPDRVLAFFACKATNQQKVAVQRHVDPDATTEQRLRRAVVAYVRGPNRAESKYLVGLGSRRMLNGVMVVGDRAIIDLDLRVGHLESTTSAQSALLWSQLSALAFQFPDVRLMEPRFNGSCFDFGDAVQAGACLVAKRGGGYALEG